MKAYMNTDGNFVLEASEAMERCAFRQWYGEQVDAGGVIYGSAYRFLGELMEQGPMYRFFC